MLPYMHIRIKMIYDTENPVQNTTMLIMPHIMT